MARFYELRTEKGEWLIVDGKSSPPRVLATCCGYDAPFNCKEIIEALEAFNTKLYNAFSMGSSNG